MSTCRHPESLPQALETPADNDVLPALDALEHRRLAVELCATDVNASVLPPLHASIAGIRSEGRNVRGAGSRGRKRCGPKVASSVGMERKRE